MIDIYKYKYNFKDIYEYLIIYIDIFFIILKIFMNIAKMNLFSENYIFYFTKLNIYINKNYYC